LSQKCSQVALVTRLPAGRRRRRRRTRRQGTAASGAGLALARSTLGCGALHRQALLLAGSQGRCTPCGCQLAPPGPLHLRTRPAAYLSSCVRFHVPPRSPGSGLQPAAWAARWGTCSRKVPKSQPGERHTLAHVKKTHRLLQFLPRAAAHRNKG
jgi:hypothetical protein